LDFELSDNLYRATALAQFEWLEHGFGTRHFQPPQSLATLRQIHSDIAVYADRPGCLAQGDALLSDVPGQMIGVKTADCVPVLLVDTKCRHVAAVHAGWRGAVAGIAPKTVAAMASRWGSDPVDIHAAIGPGIGPCCFEVGPEVAIQFGLPAERTRVDLPGFVRRQLLEAGVPGAQISALALCTFCEADLLHSFRRDRESAGRLLSVIGLKQTPRNS